MKKERSVIDFYASISRFDENLGRLRKFLSENNLSENTILIYLTDNGTSGGDAVFNAGMRGKKGSVYEGGHRVPCFIHWPAKNLDQGVDIDRMTSHIDILPTLIDLCDLKAPAKAKYKLSGKSWKGLLMDEDAGWQDRTLFIHSQNRTQHHEKWKNYLVATEEWRLVDRDELYNIKSDPGEKMNVAKDHPEIVTQLQQQYEQYWKEIGEGESPFQRNVIGSGNIEETWLNCDAWIPDSIEPETWNQSHVNHGVKNFGYWPVTIARKGTYRFEVRRWPKEVKCPINSAPAAQTVADIYNHNLPVLVGEGKIIPAVKVKLRIGDQYFEKEIDPDDEQAAFNIPLEKGDTEIQGWLIDSTKSEFPAYYVYIDG